MSRSLPAAPHRAARPPALASTPDSDDRPSRPLAASIRQNIRFPASPLFHPGACEHWYDITDQSPIRPSSTAAAAAPLSSPPLSSRPFPQNHPRLHPLRRQIPIAARQSPPYRGFLLRRLSDDGPLYWGHRSVPGRHPKPFTIANLRRDGGQPYNRPFSVTGVERPAV